MRWPKSDISDFGWGEVKRSRVNFIGIGFGSSQAGGGRQRPHAGGSFRLEQIGKQKSKID